MNYILLFEIKITSYTDKEHLIFSLSEDVNSSYLLGKLPEIERCDQNDTCSEATQLHKGC